MGRNWTSPSAHAAVHANFDAGRSRVGGARFWIFPHGGGCEFLLLRAAVTTKNAISDPGLAIRAAPRVTQVPR